MPRRESIAVFALVLVLAASLGCETASTAVRVAKMTVRGDTRELREDDESQAARASDRPSILIVAIDGMKREVLYDLLKAGDLPGLTSLLGGRESGRFPHAHLDRSVLAPLPSLTIAGWASVFTGHPPSRNGIPGNEFFIREERRLVAPLPMSFGSVDPVLATYTDDYANDLLEVPSIYERLREREPGIVIWVSLNQFYRGADRLIVGDRTAVVDMFTARAKDIAAGEAYESFQERDQEMLENVFDELDGDDDPLPDVLTVYVSGADNYTHLADEGPDEALGRYIRGTPDRMLGRLAEALERRGALENCYVVVVSEHGHSPVSDDERFRLSTRAENDPPAVLRRAGFRVRPFELEVGEDDDFQAVLAYQGPMGAYVYLADRSTCPQKKDACEWRRPPRFKEDVLAVAEAYFQANRTGRHAARMKGALDMVLARRPRPFAEDDLPFEVYVGGGRLVPIGEYLEAHPHPTYVAFESRLRELAMGRYGERAGDVLLLARNGVGKGPEGRYYFDALTEKSVHGSASRQDSESVFVLAHRGKSAPELKQTAREVLGKNPRVRRVGDLILHLRRMRSPRPRMP